MTEQELITQFTQAVAMLMKSGVPFDKAFREIKHYGSWKDDPKAIKKVDDNAAIIEQNALKISTDKYSKNAAQPQAQQQYFDMGTMQPKTPVEKYTAQNEPELQYTEPVAQNAAKPKTLRVEDSVQDTHAKTTPKSNIAENGGLQHTTPEFTPEYMKAFDIDLFRNSNSNYQKWLKEGGDPYSHTSPYDPYATAGSMANEEYRRAYVADLQKRRKQYEAYGDKDAVAAIDKEIADMSSQWNTYTGERWGTINHDNVNDLVNRINNANFDNDSIRYSWIQKRDELIGSIIAKGGNVVYDAKVGDYVPERGVFGKAKWPEDEVIQKIDIKLLNYNKRFDADSAAANKTAMSLQNASGEFDTEAVAALARQGAKNLAAQTAKAMVNYMGLRAKYLAYNMRNKSAFKGDRVGNEIARMYQEAEKAKSIMQEYIKASQSANRDEKYQQEYAVEFLNIIESFPYSNITDDAVTQIKSIADTGNDTNTSPYEAALNKNTKQEAKK